MLVKCQFVHNFKKYDIKLLCKYELIVKLKLFINYKSVCYVIIILLLNIFKNVNKTGVNVYKFCRVQTQ
jgi:hypothetical protein